MNLRRAALLLLPALLLTGCGPTDEEVARSVLFVTPVPFVVALGALYGLSKLWRRVRPDTVMDLRPGLYGLVFLVCFSGLALTGQPIAQGDTPPEWSRAKVLDIAGIALALY